MNKKKQIEYNKIDHYHCWSQKDPACGQKIEHYKCCLCEELNPKIEQHVETVLLKVRQRIAKALHFKEKNGEMFLDITEPIQKILEDIK